MSPDGEVEVAIQWNTEFGLLELFLFNDIL